MLRSSTKFDDGSKMADTDLRIVARRDFLVAGAVTAAGFCMNGSQAFAEAENGSELEALVSEALVSEAPVSDADRAFMRQAVQLMRQAGVVDRTGGPFGAVVVRDGQVLAAAGNSVMRDHDPSAHAEVNAIRAACQKAGAPNLSGAVLYSSCEPCPMCYATAYWARVDKIFYAASWVDYADLFDDSNISQDMQKSYPQRHVALQQIMRPEAQLVWDDFRKLPDPARY
jgi:tRNA(Arg) A34 adenosine deaminase TadA